jgi:signal transduction histidine kinase/CHASE1-domain containing sensor protein
MRGRMPFTAVWRWRYVPYVVLAASLAMTIAAASIAHREVEKRDEVSFHKSVDQLESVLTQELDTDVALLHGAAGLFAADPLVNADEFHAFVERLDLRARYPAIMGIGYTARVLPGGRDSFVAWRRLSEPGYAIRPPPGERETFPVAFLEPPDARNREVLGYDVHSEPTRAAAMDDACDRGGAVATRKVVLLQDGDATQRYGFVIFLPIYRGGTPPDSLRERRAALLGFVTAPFRTVDLVDDLLSSIDLPLDLSIYDGESLDDAGLMYGKPGAAVTGRFTEQRIFSLAAHRWTVVYRARPELFSSRELVLLILLGGLAATALLFGTTMMQARAHARSERTAAELRRSELALTRTDERLRFLAGASAILGSSLEYEKTLANVASLAIPTMADWSAVDLIADDGNVQRLTVAHADPAKVALALEVYRRWPPGPGDPPSTVIATGQPLIAPEITDAMLAGAARHPEQLRIWRELGLRSALVVPLKARERVLGAITLVTSESGRHYADEDVAVAEDVARRAAAAIDNARLYQVAERVSAALARHAEELGRSNAELEQFAYVASHDLQEPLRMINNYLDLLLRRYGDRFAGQPAEYMTFAIDGAKRMQALIKDLLTFSRAGRSDELATAEVDARGALDEALKNLARTIEESGATVTAGPLPRVVFDRLQLLQLFQNLVGNAIKFHGAAPPLVTVDAVRRDACWEFSVRDNGIGIDPAHAARVFEVFQRLHTRDQYPGTGIGLAICRKIVERRGGRIWVDSVLGTGSTFLFTVPDAVPTTEKKRKADSG